MNGTTSTTHEPSRLSDDDLPGMWESADFEGGDPDTRSYAERERAELEAYRERDTWVCAHCNSAHPYSALTGSVLRVFCPNCGYSTTPLWAYERATIEAENRELFAYITRLEAKAQALVAADDPEPITPLDREHRAHIAWRTRQPLKADLAAVLEGSRE